jgi:electron transfer flavoprotein beta subunit
MKAKSKPLEIKKLNDLDLGIDLSENLKTINLRLPPKRKSGVILNSVAELIDKLKNEKGVI